ncbi:hypothetical protein CTAYLR_003456 [Chrysophaeum taylorii]|uniref:Fe2OG dioxygenase domain-containing protein n=1 Tax=Chrysophaeum taylorii TaxID=2483200 RepID=A0AAD7XI11_9STRA|nr:hypothetical protein CTAYLR_003456 [Chrysophaeum taylorii]
MLLLLLFLIPALAAQPKSVAVSVRNLSGREVMVYWLSPSGERVPQTPKPTKHGSSASINSYEGHRFEVRGTDAHEKCDMWASMGECKKNPRYMLKSCAGACGGGGRATFAVADVEEFLTVDRDWSVSRESFALRARRLLERIFDECGDESCGCAAPQIDQFLAEKVSEVELEIRISGAPPSLVVEPPSCDARACIDEVVSAADHLDRAAKELRKGTKEKAERLRNESCAVPERPTTFQDHPNVSLWWEGRRVRDLFHYSFMPEARISMVEDFVTADECREMMARARPRLQRATHAHDGDLTHVSEARDAQQATVTLPAVQARTISLANFLSNYSLPSDGQEALMAIQYTRGQQYMLHCDGSCDGTPFLSGGRLATVLMYCQNADEGGATTFPNAGVHVSPALYSAVYFHFRHPTTNLTEAWHTEHSGCPVLSGEKWVITHWLRAGVSKEQPASRFSPFGGPNN